MLEKNKDYVEFALRTMMVTHKPYQDHADVGITGIIPDCEIFAANNPLDIPCDVVMVPKKDFDRLQEDNQHYRELAKQWEENYNLLLQKTGFETVEGLIFYLTNIGKCDTLHGAINRSNNSWKAATECNTPEAAKDRINGLMNEAVAWADDYNHLLALTGFDNEGEIEDFLEQNHDRNKLTTVIDNKIQEIYKWQNVTGFSSPEDYTGGWEGIRRLCNEIYKSNGDTEPNWQKATGCATPAAAKTLIESGMSYEYAYHEEQKKTRKLADDVKSWKNVTGYSTPEDYMHARLNNTTPFDYMAAWLKATGCSTPEEVKSRIEGLENAIRLTNKNMLSEIESNIDEWQKATGCVSPEKALYKITDLYNRIDKMKEAASIASNWTDKIVEG